MTSSALLSRMAVLPADLPLCWRLPLPALASSSETDAKSSISPSESTLEKSDIASVGKLAKLVVLIEEIERALPEVTGDTGADACGSRLDAR